MKPTRASTIEKTAYQDFFLMMVAWLSNKDQIRTLGQACRGRSKAMLFSFHHRENIVKVESDITVVMYWQIATPEPPPSSECCACSLVVEFASVSFNSTVTKGQFRTSMAKYTRTGDLLVRCKPYRQQEWVDQHLHGGVIK